MTVILQPKDIDPGTSSQKSCLTFGERLFLKTCCYNPPRPRRVRTLEGVQDTDHFAAEYEHSYGPQVWDVIRGKEVLDLGCGEGGHVLALAARGAGHVTGLDTLPEFQNAEEEGRRRDYPVTFIGAGTESLPDASYDVIFSHDSFEHFAQPEQVLAEMTRLIRPGGRLMIKFGPPWRNPWGRHMGGTVRRDRPWIHLVVPERTVMRVQSVYHNEPVLKERYADLPGGLNKMTVGRFQRLLKNQDGIRIEQFYVKGLYGIQALAGIPVVREFFASSVRVVAVRI